MCRRGAHPGLRNVDCQRDRDHLYGQNRFKPDRERNAGWIFIAFTLGQHWSPEQVSPWLRRTYLEDASIRLSRKSIYRSIYMNPLGFHGSIEGLTFLNAGRLPVPECGIR